MTAEEARRAFADVAWAVRQHLDAERIDGDLVVTRLEARCAVDEHERWLEIEAAHEATKEANRG